jgi:hypothetical protein
MRVLAPALAAHGWEPVVLTVDPSYYEGHLDQELAAAIDPGIEVVRCAALPAALTRRLGVGDLGLRALPHLARAARRIVESRGIDALYLTTYPIYHALIGPWLKRTTSTPFVLDLQDPWVSAWGAEVGPRPDGTPDAKSRASRALGARLERLVVPHADAITGVSSDLLDDLATRYPQLSDRPRAVIPIGVTPSDVTWLRRQPTPTPEADVLRLVYAGTLLPLGHETVRALFCAMRLADQAGGGRRIATHFIGTSNQARGDVDARVLPLARECGVADRVTEQPSRVPFFSAFRALLQADAVLLLGTSEARYTASKLASALVANRPILAVFHEGSDVTRALRPLAARDPGIALIEYGASRPVASTVPEIARRLAAWRQMPPPAPTHARDALEPFLADRLARRLAGILDAAASPVHA